MQKKTLMLGVGALVVLGALLAWAFAPRPLQVEATAVGATRAQFPELPVPALGDAAQVFAEPAH